MLSSCATVDRERETGLSKMRYASVTPRPRNVMLSRPTEFVRECAFTGAQGATDATLSTTHVQRSAGTGVDRRSEGMVSA